MTATAVDGMAVAAAAAAAATVLVAVVSLIVMDMTAMLLHSVRMLRCVCSWVGVQAQGQTCTGTRARNGPSAQGHSSQG